MRYLISLFFTLLFTLQSYAQSGPAEDLNRLAKDFQNIFREKGLVLDKPLDWGGLYFSDGPMFYRIQDSVYWVTKEHEENRPLDSLILVDGNIQDSIVYMLLGVSDPETKSQAIDIYRYGDVDGLKDLGFPNPGVGGEFTHGMREFKRSLAAGICTSVQALEDSSRFTVYFSNTSFSQCMAVDSDHEPLKNAVNRYFFENEVKYVPPIRFGGMLYSYYVFEVKKTSDGIHIENVGSGEPFFCSVAAKAIYLIEPLHEQKSSEYRQMSFFYDSKWTEEEFLESAGIRTMRHAENDDTLTDVLKQFRNRKFPKPFSAIYGIHKVPYH